MVIVENDHQNFLIDNDHVSSIVKSLPARHPSSGLPILKKFNDEYLTVKSEIDEVKPPTFCKDPEIYDKLKSTNPVKLEPKYRNPSPHTNFPVYPNDYKASKQPVDQNSSATLIFLF
jgi:hypothetical protein